MASPSEQEDRYRILRSVGSGGMGEVFLAEDAVLDRRVALKFLPDAAQEDPVARQRLLREAKAAAALDHPFICKVYEVGELDGRSFIAMEYIEGETLAKRLRREPLPFDDAVVLALEITEALAEAHDKGFVHRDLKPANVMVTPHGHAKVMDFGLAKRSLVDAEGSGDVSEAATALTREGSTFGTLAYMSPEQARGEAVDARSDVFSFGILLHEMLSGEHPFARSSPMETLSAILRDDPAPLPELPPVTGEGLGEVLAGALAKDPAERHPDASALAAALRRTARSPKATIAGPRFASGLAVAALVLVVLLFVGGWWMSGGTPAETTPPPQPVVVLVADLHNGTGEPLFEGAIEQSLAIGLEGAPYLSTYDRQGAKQVAADLGSTDGSDRLDVATAQLVARSQGINLVVGGGLERTDEGYELTLQAHDPVAAEEVAAASERFTSKADFNRAVHEAARQLASQLGGLPPGFVEAVSRETFTTSSLEAMNAYARAQDAVAAGGIDEAIDAYEQAIREDPEFGRAYSGLGALYFNRGQRDRALEYYEKALEHIDRMSERERYRTRGLYYIARYDYRKAAEEYASLTERYPADHAGPVMLAYAYFSMHELDRAVEAGLRSVEQTPDGVDHHYNLAWYALMAGDLDLAEQEIDEVLRLNPEYDQANLPLALLRALQGQPAARVREAYEELRGSPWGPYTPIGLADLSLYHGRAAEAEARLRTAIEGDLAGRAEGLALPYARVVLAESLLAQGRQREALEAAQRATDGTEQPSVLYAASRVQIECGRHEDGLRTAAALGESLQPMPRAYGRLLEGEVALRRGDTTRALEAFREAQELVDSWLGRFGLGRTYLAAGEFAQAHSEFEMCWERRGEAASVFFDEIPSLRYLPPVHYYLGRALEGMGSDEGAVEAYRAFLAIKKEREGGSMVEDAQQRLRALGSTSDSATGR